ncbi:hypothetical protein M885DRAFT_557349 [Pelagophyceae sp. CCMP2097]|nr:hypothetical protein M885DRAFT_557349 [Pelagophyceae sp. CCMP2097]
MDTRSDDGWSNGDSVLSRDWTVTLHEVSYATGDGRVLLEDATAVAPGGSTCALAGPTVADKGALLRLLAGAARGGYFAGRVAFGGQPYHDAHLLTAFVESPASYDGVLTPLGGGVAAEALPPATLVEFAALLRFGRCDAARDRAQAMIRVLKLDEASRAAAQGAPAAQAEAVVARIACALVQSQPVVLVEDPFRGAGREGALRISRAMNTLAARGHTVIASLESRALGDDAFAAFARVIVLRDGRVLYSGETKKAAQHCVVYAPLSEARGDKGSKFEMDRLDAIERCASDGPSAAACRAAYLRTAVARRQEHEASHREPADNDSTLHWLTPLPVPPIERFVTLIDRSFHRKRSALDRHVGSVALALVWGAALWDCGHGGKDSLAFYDVTAVAFACAQLVVTSNLAHAPSLCRAHAEFERERRMRSYGGVEYVAARTVVLVADSLAAAVAPLVLYVVAGMPLGFHALCYAYLLFALLAFSLGCLVEALVAFAHAPPPVDAQGGGGLGFSTARAVSGRAERQAIAAYGAFSAAMLLCTGFGVQLSDLPQANPMLYLAQVNHARWGVQGLVLKMYATPAAHLGDFEIKGTGWDSGTGWPKSSPSESLLALAALALAARLVSYDALSKEAPRARLIESKKLHSWASRAPAVVNEDLKGEVGKKGSSKLEKPCLVAADVEIGASASETAFAFAIEAFPVSLAAHGVSLAAKTPFKSRKLLAEVTLAVSSREAVLICADDPDAPRCLLRALAGREARRFGDEDVCAAGRIALNASQRPQTFRSMCAWLPAGGATLEAHAALTARETCRYALHLAGPRVSSGASDGKKYAARTAEGDFEAPSKNLEEWWIGVSLDVAGVSEAQRDGVVDGGLLKRRILLAIELIRAPLIVFCDDVGGTAAGTVCGARHALASRDAAKLAVTYAGLARLGCAVVATAHDAARDVAMAFDRVALLVQLGENAFCRLVADGAPVEVLRPKKRVSLQAVYDPSRDAALRPFHAAALKFRLAYDASPTPLAFPETRLGEDALAPSAVLPAQAFLTSFPNQFSVLFRRELACVDRGALGSTAGFALVQALLLGAAFFGQGREDPRVVVWLSYLLVAFFLAPNTLQLARHLTLAHDFFEERERGVDVAPFFAAQLFSRLPLDCLRVVIVVPAVFACANFDLAAFKVVEAGAACVIAAHCGNSLSLAAVWAYASKPALYGIPEPQQAVERLTALSKASLLSMVSTLVLLLFTGLWRFIADLDFPWRVVAKYDFARWLVEAISLPQLRGQDAPNDYDTSKSAIEFVGYKGDCHTLIRAVVLGAAPIDFAAAVALFFLTQN